MFMTVRSRKSMGDVRQRFEEAAAERKFGVQGIHNVKATLNSKIRISAALPCRVSIYEEGREIVLETLRPTVLLKMFREPSLDVIAKEVETVIGEIMTEAAKEPVPR